MTLPEAFAVGGVKPTYADVVAFVRERYLGIHLQNLATPSAEVQQDAEARAALEQDTPSNRRKRIRERLRWYRDDSIDDIKAVIDAVFEDARVREQRKRLAEYAQCFNVTARLIEEISTLYDRPPARRFSTDADRDRYRTWSDAVDLDGAMAEACRLCNLTNDVLLWPTDTALNIITSDGWDEIASPINATQVVGRLIDFAPGAAVGYVGIPQRLPHYRLYDEVMVITLDGQGIMIGKPEPHGQGRIPGVVVHRSRPVDRLQDDRAGRDIIATHKAIALLNVMTMRLSKSQGERQPLLTGPLARMAAGQSMDGESPIALPPEVEASMLDTKTDPDHYLRVMRHLLAGLGARYGISYERFVFSETSASSVLSAQREKRAEVRRGGSKMWRRAERELAAHRGVGLDGFHVDFQEAEVPADPMADLDLMWERSKKGLDSPLKWILRRDPDYDDTQAAADQIAENLSEFGMVLAAIRSQNLPLEGEGGDQSGRTPEENGRLGGRPPMAEKGGAPMKEKGGRPMAKEMDTPAGKEHAA